MENKKVSFPIAAVFLAISALIGLVNRVQIVLMGLGHLIGFWSWIGLALSIATVACLVMKKRDHFLLILLAVNAVLSLFDLFRGFGLSNLLAFAGNAALLAMALIFCEQTLIPLDLSKYKDLAQKLYFVPAAAELAAFLIYILSIILNPGYGTTFMSVLNSLLVVAYKFTLAMWLKDPFAAPAVSVNVEGAAATGYAGAEGNAAAATGYAGAEANEAYCSLGKHIVLCLFTFGIWYLIWTYRTTKFLNRAPGAVPYDPMSKLLLCMFIPFYQIYWFYKHGQRIDAMCRARGMQGSDMATTCLVLAIFIPIVGCILMQDRINTLCSSQVYY